MKELGTIEEEAAECRKAFEGVEVGAPVWCCHHERLSEVLDEPAENRITYILTSKDRSEQAIRLREFRPVKDMAKIAPLDADYEAKIAPLDADYEAKRATLDADLTALHLAEYPDTAWNGRSIFE